MDDMICVVMMLVKVSFGLFIVSVVVGWVKVLGYDLQVLFGLLLVLLCLLCQFDGCGLVVMLDGLLVFLQYSGLLSLVWIFQICDGQL